VVNTPNAARGPSPLKNLPEASTEQLIGSLNYTHDFGSIKLRSITGYVKTTDFFSTDFSGNGLVNGANNAAVKQWSEELQLLGSAAGEKLRYIAGIYLFSEEGTQRFGWNSYVPFPPFNIFTAVPVSSSDISMKTKSYSFFGQVDYLFTDNLKGSLGVRYTSDDKDFNMAFQSAFGGPPSLTPFSDTFSKTTPKASIDWQIASGGTIDSMLLYASAANAFKSGGYSAIAIFGNGDVAPYKPETNWTYELGMKTDMLGNRLRINANYFYSNVKDIVINQTLPGGRFPVNNAGDATIKGLEFELTAVPIEGLTLFLNGALLDGEYKNLNPFAAPALAPVNFDVQAVPPQIPDYSFAIGFDYKHAVASGGEFSFGADWYQTDDYITAATNDFRVKGYGLGNAFVGYGWNENWSARVTAKNLADNNIINTGSRGFLGGFIPVRPREIMLTINYKAK
jgi:iron complex outermembrane receptor protein